MSTQDWEDLSERHFGEVLFSNKGIAIPEAISEGDLDGDQYYICWDASIVQHIKPVDPMSAADFPLLGGSNEPSKIQLPLGDQWLDEARTYMMSDGASATKRLIGKLYCASERVADKSPQGLQAADARAFFKAYVQAIDAGKHGCAIDLPEHLRKEVGM